MGPKTMAQSGRLLAVLAIIIIVIVLVALGALGVGAHRITSSDVIADGVKIAGVPVGGMTAQQAKEAVNTQTDHLLPETIEIKFGQQNERINPQSLGITADVDSAVAQAMNVGRSGNFLSVAINGLMRRGVEGDIPVRCAVDEAALDAALADLAKRLGHKPEDARLMVKDGKVEVVPEKRGFVVDVEATKANILTAVKNGKVDTIECVGKEAAAKVKTTDCAGIDTVLADYKTDYSEGKVDRTHNLAIAIKNINGQVLMPGDILSLNEAIGERDESKGYREAPIFVNGEITPSTGGGVCQIASTVYNAALLAGLDIVERHHHSLPVTYVPAGRDATIYYGQLDLKVKNTYTHPVVFIGDVGGGTVEVKIMGRKADKVEVALTHSDLKKTPFQTKEIPDPDLPKGKRKISKPGKPGIEITVSRIITKNGVKGAPEELHTDTYSAQTQEVHVGTKAAATPVGAVDLLGSNGAPANGKPAHGKKPPKKPQQHPADLD